MAQMAPGLTSFHITPVDPEFQMHTNDFEDGYDMKSIESMFAARIAGDILVNYRDEIKNPFFDPLSARARATRDWRPALS
jgi:hypothetical protein